MNDNKSLDETLDLFAAGVDDVVRKPIHVREILARIRAIRARIHVSGEGTVVGQLRVFSDGRDPEVKGEVLPLPRRERRILEYLVNNKDCRVTKTQIFNYVYGLFSDDIDENVVESPRQQTAQAPASSPRLRPDRFPALPRISPDPVVTRHLPGSQAPHKLRLLYCNLG